MVADMKKKIVFKIFCFDFQYIKYLGGQIYLIYFRIKIQSSQSFVLWSIPGVCFGYAITMFKRMERKWKFAPFYFIAENYILVKEFSI